MSKMKTDAPTHSRLFQEVAGYDYVDCYQVFFVDEKNSVTIQDVGKAFLQSSPKWMMKFIQFRDRVASLIGLKQITFKPKFVLQNLTPDSINAITFEPEKNIGFFHVYEVSEKEIILGENDKHLNFRISLWLDANADDSAKKKIMISTAVKFHNGFGRLYFFFVKPFHKRIVPIMAKNVITYVTRYSYPNFTNND